jgi:hypothetical protein
MESPDEGNNHSKKSNKNPAQRYLWTWKSRPHSKFLEENHKQNCFRFYFLVNLKKENSELFFNHLFLWKWTNRVLPRVLIYVFYLFYGGVGMEILFESSNFRQVLWNFPLIFDSEVIKNPIQTMTLFSESNRSPNICSTAIIFTIDQSPDK